MKNKAPFVPELSRPLMIDRIPNGGIKEHMVARPDERRALAERFDLLELTRLEADLEVDLVRAGKIVVVAGSFEADVVQACVVTLEPIKARLKGDIKGLFAPPELLDPGVGGSMHDDINEEEAPEPIEKNTIDLGEVVSQHLALAIDPYPRLPEAALPAVEAPPPVKASIGAFESLKGPLKDSKH